MRHRGFTIVELTAAMGIMLFVVFGTAAMMLTGLRTFGRTVDKTSANQDNAMTIRRISESIRGAMNVSLSTDGTQIQYTMPMRSNANDPITGEPELIHPLTSDGVVRGYTVSFTTGRLTDSQSGRVLLENIAGTDPDAGSSQYGQAYKPFQLTTIGSMRAVTINIITSTGNGPERKRHARMKSTALVRNAQ
jgi:Tfp pilus assembly protein PilW